MSAAGAGPGPCTSAVVRMGVAGIARGRDMADDARKRLRESDLELIRVLEDVIKVLLDKGIIELHDLPEAARSKLLRRQVWRGRMKPRGKPGAND